MDAFRGRATARRTYKLGTLLACVLAAGAIAACGDDSDEAAAGGSASGGAKLTKMTAAAASFDAAYVPLYLGIEKGYFRDEGIDLQVQQAGASQLASVFSGQSQIFPGAMSPVFASINEGKPLTFSHVSYAGGLTGFVAGKPGVKSIQDCKTMATFSPGGGTYAWSVAYKNAYDLPDMKLRSSSDYANIAAMLASKRADCATGTYGLLNPLVTKGAASWIIDPRKDLPEELAGIPDSGFGYEPKTVSENRDAVVGWIRGYLRTMKDIKSTPPLETAKYIQEKVEGFRAQPAEVLAESIEVTRDFAPDDPAISQDVWGKMLDFLKNAGLEFIDPSDEKYSYDSVVDNSLVEDAQKG